MRIRQSSKNMIKHSRRAVLLYLYFCQTILFSKNGRICTRDVEDVNVVSDDFNVLYKNEKEGGRLWPPHVLAVFR